MKFTDSIPLISKTICQAQIIYFGKKIRYWCDITERLPVRYHVDILIYGSTSIKEEMGSDTSLRLEF